jgi:hypothetical protein
VEFPAVELEALPASGPTRRLTAMLPAAAPNAPLFAPGFGRSVYSGAQFRF